MPKKSTSTKSRIAVVLESTELEVYTHRGRRSLLARLTGQWLKVKATVFDNGLFRVKALEPGVKYEKLMALVKETTISVATVSGRANCLVLTNFHESSGSSKGGSQRGGGATTVKRVFHCKSVDKRHEWQTTLIAACAKGSKAVAGRQTLHKKKKPRSVLGSKKDDDHDGGRNGGRPRNLESFLQWHEEGYLYASFTRATKARRAWWRAIDAVARDVLNQRYHSRGYSSLALVRLHRKINQVDKDTVADIKRKARRILRHLLRELRVARKKKSNVTFADVVAREAAKHGVIIHDTTRGDRGDPRPSLEHHLAAAAAISPATMKDAAAAAAGGGGESREDALPDEGDAVGEEDAVLEGDEDEVRQGRQGPDEPVREHDGRKLELEGRRGLRQDVLRGQGPVDEQGNDGGDDFEDEEEQGVHRRGADGLVQEQLGGDGVPPGPAAAA
mmetsp:Transcript_354/g.1295  ORF Transcript_354/g.1295 Transcript_354/m.1295 type:complete len:445 (+) Transcript_354:97-1431(+)